MERGISECVFVKSQKGEKRGGGPKFHKGMKDEWDDFVLPGGDGEKDAGGGKREEGMPTS